MQTFFFYWYITSPKVAVVFLVDAASFYSLLSHGLLYRPIAAFLKGITLCNACKNTAVDSVVGGIRFKTWFNELEQQAILLNVYFSRCTTPSEETEWGYFLVHINFSSA